MYQPDASKHCKDIYEVSQFVKKQTFFTNMKYLIKIRKEYKNKQTNKQTNKKKHLFASTSNEIFQFLKEESSFILSHTFPHLNLFYLITLAYEGFCIQRRLKMPLKEALLINTVSKTITLFVKQSFALWVRKLKSYIWLHISEETKSKNA